MLNRYDIFYGVGLVLAAPAWLVWPKWRRRIAQAFKQQMGREWAGQGVGRGAVRAGGRTVMIHAVSAGEMNATPALVAYLRKEGSGVRFIISATSNAGFEAARKHHGSSEDVTLIRYPLDFSGAVRRVLDGVRPDLVVLMELEVWPNFMRHCAARGIPVVLVQGRLTESSYRNYRRFGLFTRPMFRRLAMVCAQDETYAKRFEAVGVESERIRIAGTMKFDTATIAKGVGGALPGGSELAAAVGLKPGQEPIWVCGSTGEGEEAMILRCYAKLLGRFGRLRLVIVPRHPPRFDSVAELVKTMRFPLIRRSQASAAGERTTSTGLPAVVLGDTMGELARFYSVANVVFVGRTLVDLGARQRGSDMIEPAALGKPIVVGPYTANFAEPMNFFRGAEGIIEAADEGQLYESIGVLLSSPDQAQLMGFHAQEVVRREQGSTAKHGRIILEELEGAGRG